MSIFKFMGPATLLAASLCGCNQMTTEPPTNPGRLLVGDEIRLVTDGKSLNGQRVSIDGYALFCSLNGMYRSGNVVDIEIHATRDCRSRTIAAAKVRLLRESAASPGLMASGVRPRNAVLIGDIFSNEHVKFLTDDYTVLPPKGVVRVSGVVNYQSDRAGSPELEGISLHGLN
ncbi:hypothetical protein QTI66_06405 [Variovorax sp. J22R133]|uniref:hypothetical protein n=1 Tax=Variovorax brevis TaxID=3053503 RepID=UPI0025757129|nr:hypothetical protein [Variovorax sp. J22R133]MDM0111774.1 hypothetical protein [Variovorax sp. J22R133]